MKIAQLVAVNVLKSFNFTVTVAETGLEALALITKNAYAIIFMDIGLPGDLDGFMVAEKIRTTENPNKNTTMIALTVHDEESYVKKSIQCGIDRFLVKPLTVAKIKQVLPSANERSEKA